MTKKAGIGQSAPATQTTEQTFALQSADTDGVKASFTTQTTAQTYSGAALNGALISSGELSGTEARNITATLTSVAGAYTSGGSILVVGKHPYYTNPDGTAVDQTETLTIPDADGGYTLVGAKMFKAGEPLTVTFPAMPNTNGSAEIGCGVGMAIVPPSRWIWANDVGDLYVRMKNSSDQEITMFSILSTGPHPLAIEAIHASTTLTSFHAIPENDE